MRSTRHRTTPNAEFDCHSRAREAILMRMEEERLKRTTS
jgi:hypothetical protein